MITVTIEPADNGIIKILYDDSVNGAGEEFVSRMVYDFDSQEARENQARFLEDLILDLGLDIGTELDEDQLQVTVDWGDKYKPNQKEIQDRLENIEAEKARLEAMLNKK